jgi:hypothetical protein
MERGWGAQLPAFGRGWLGYLYVELESIKAIYTMQRVSEKGEKVKENE